MYTQAFVIGVGHRISGFVKIRPHGDRGPPRIHLKHHFVVSGLCKYQRRWYAPQVIFFIIITASLIKMIDIIIIIINYRSRVVEKQRVGKTKIKYVIISSGKQKHNQGREFSVFSYFQIVF